MANQQRTQARTNPTTRHWWQHPIAWIAVLVLAAAAITGIITASSGGDETAAQTAAAEAIGTPLPPLTSPDPAVGMTAPTISAQTLTGERLQLVPDGDTARLFGFFAHWCPACQAEVPQVVAWLEEHTIPEGVEVVAISTGVDASRGNYPPSEWFVRENFQATVLVDSEQSSLAGSFGLTAFPYWVAVDADGAVVARISGGITEADFLALLDALDPAATVNR